jgi:hypothetical protein
MMKTRFMKPIFHPDDDGFLSFLSPSRFAAESLCGAPRVQMSADARARSLFGRPGAPAPI